jgi:cystathionine beta-lyase/cystathionine gamma-synthase
MESTTTRGVETPREQHLVKSYLLRVNAACYSILDNDTIFVIETQLARLYDCSRAFAVSTGMTALDIILRLISPGDVVLAGTDIYGGTDRLLTYVKTNGGVDVKHLDLDKKDRLEEVLEQCGQKIKMVLLESPTNPLLKIADLRMISNLVHGASPVSNAPRHDEGLYMMLMPSPDRTLWLLLTTQ